MPKKASEYNNFVKSKKGGKGKNFLKDCAMEWEAQKKKGKGEERGAFVGPPDRIKIAHQR